MQKSTLLTILRTFSKQELSRFHDFLKSPYFNKKEGVIKLYEALKKNAPDFSDDKLAKEEVWTRIFPDEQYNYGIMKNLIFELQKLAVKFIGVEHTGKNEISNNISISDQYISRGLTELADKLIKETAKDIKDLGYDPENLYNSFLFGKKEQSLLALEHDIRDLKISDFTWMNASLAKFYFSEFFFSNYNSLQISFLYNYKIDKEKYDSFLNAYLSYDEKDDFTDISYYAFMTVYEPFDEKYYYELKELYYKNFDKLSRASRFYVNTALINFCKNNSNSGKLFFIKERYQYVKIMMEHRLFGVKEENNIDRYFLMNAVIAGCTAGDYDWCEDIIEKNKSLVKEEVRDLFVNFAYTHLNFKKKDFSRALDYLAKCTGAMGMDKINLKVYQFFLYYELGYYEELKNLVDTSRHFVNNDKNISDHSKNEFLNFINTVSKLSDLRYHLNSGKADEFGLEVLKKTVSETTMSGKNWLNEKLSDLKK